MRNDENSINPAIGKIQKLSMFSHGNATSRAPIFKRKDEIAESAGQQRDDDQPDHRAAVNAIDLVIRLGRDEAAVGVKSWARIASASNRQHEEDEAVMMY